MIIVLGHIKLARGEGAKIAGLLAAHSVAVQAEDGCDQYSFSFDAGDPDLVRIAELWASPEALAAHGEAPHQKAFGHSLRDFTMEAISVKAYDGHYWRTLLGE